MKWMRVPRDVVFAFVTAVRFIPVVMLDTFQIMDAQKSRGLELEKGNLIDAGQEHGPDSHPAGRQLGHQERGAGRGDGVEGVRLDAQPTSLYRMRLKWYDWAVLFASLAAFAVALYIYHFFRFPDLMIPPRVVVDERERGSGVPEELSKLNVRVYYSRLPIADYVISPEIAAERKSLPGLRLVGLRRQALRPGARPSRAPTGSRTSSSRATSKS